MAESSVDKTKKKKKEKNEWDNVEFVPISTPQSPIPNNISSAIKIPVKDAQSSATATTTTTTTTLSTNKKLDKHNTTTSINEPFSKHVKVSTNSETSAVEYFKKKNSSTIIHRGKSSQKIQQQNHYMTTNNNKRIIEDKEYINHRQREGIPIIYIIYDEISAYYNTSDIIFAMLRWETHSNNGITWIDPNHPYIRVFRETWTKMEWRRREVVEPKTSKLTAYGCDSDKFEQILSAIWKQFHLHGFFDYNT